jgi:hypothetical protein
MQVTADLILLIVAVILFVVSAFNVQSPVDLFKLAWAFVVGSLIF